MKNILTKQPVDIKPVMPLLLVMCRLFYVITGVGNRGKKV